MPGGRDTAAVLPAPLTCPLLQYKRLYPHIAERDAAEGVNATWLKTLNEANYRFRHAGWAGLHKSCHPPVTCQPSPLPAHRLPGCPPCSVCPAAYFVWLAMLPPLLFVVQKPQHHPSPPSPPTACCSEWEQQAARRLQQGGSRRPPPKGAGTASLVGSMESYGQGDKHKRQLGDPSDGGDNDGAGDDRSKRQCKPSFGGLEGRVLPPPHLRGPSGRGSGSGRVWGGRGGGRGRGRR
jgi:hypothetical protein